MVGDARVSVVRSSLISGAVAVVVFSIAWFVYSANPVPAEDAAMLFRYSENVAAGHGIVYNPGGEHVDGATDMLFMLGLALLVKVGIPVQGGAAALNALGLAVICGLVLWAWRRWGPGPLIWSVVAVILILLGPVWTYGSLGFGTVTFAASATVVAVVSELASRRPALSRLLLLGAFVGVCGLIRPEGFFLAPLIVLAQAWRVRSWRLLLVPAGVWLPVVAFFVASRWIYFGYPLPNPFYRKSGGSLHPVALRSMAALMLRSGLPVLVGVIVAAFLDETRRRASSLVMIFAGWTCAWLLISDEMNELGRFQYSIVPVLFVLSAPLYGQLMPTLARTQPSLRRWVLAAVSVTAVFAALASIVKYTLPAGRALATQVLDPNSVVEASIHEQLAGAFANHAGNGHRVLATTEAGYMAWQSGWNTTDLWGLNDKYIAHNGYLAPAELEQLNPELVFAHVPTSTTATTSTQNLDNILPGWPDMTDQLLCFTGEHGYALIGEWGDSGRFVVLARPDLPDIQALRTDLQPITYRGLPNTAATGSLPMPASCPD